MKKLLLFCLLFIGAMSFSTAQTQYYFEDFEGGFPAGWTIEGDFMYGTTATLNSQFLEFTGNNTSFVAFNDDALGQNHVGGGRLISPPIDLTAATGNVFLEMNLFYTNAVYQGADETFQLLVSTDGGTSWDLVRDFGGYDWSVDLIRVDDWAGQTIMLAFDYDDGGGWVFGAAVDDISISDEPLFFDRRNYIMTVNGGSIMSQVKANIDYPIQGLVYNKGWESITSFDINVTNNGLVTTYSFDNMDIPLEDAYTYEIPDMINVGDAFSIYNVAITNVNGDATPDSDVANNTANLVFNPISNIHPDKGVLAEEATGTWCTWCPRGTVYMDELSKRFGKNFVGVAVHNDDPMAVDAYDNAISGQSSNPGFLGWPSVVYNRRLNIDAEDLLAPSLAEWANAPIAALSVGAAVDGPIFNSSIEVEFMQDVANANYRVAIVLTEDELTGDTPDWDQVSGAYTNNNNGPMGGFEYLPLFVPSHFWPYDHVGRALIGNYAGVNNIVVGSYTVGDVDSYFFPPYVLPATWNRDNMHVIGILLGPSGDVINAVKSSYNDAVANGLSTGIEDIAVTNFEVYPNPVSDRAIIKLGLDETKEIKASLLNSLGQKVSSQYYGELSGNLELEYNMEGIKEGMYFLNIEIDNEMITKRLTKS